ncbi:MAG: phosphonate C-P lyase system protein PhnH [Cognatishimia sp.]|nr:phosphonate C-P lyase system protein PhnH [Cognatishimia sp.]
MSATALEGGFKNPPHDSARAFRALMNAMARPGSPHEVAGAQPPAPMSIAAGVLLLTLCDGDTGIYLTPEFDTEEIRTWISFHIGAPFVAPMKADFAVGRWDELAPIDRFAIGDAEYPDRSTTLVIEGQGSEDVTLKGPGIKDTQAFALPEVAPFQNNRALFPLGRDFYFTQGAKLAALPRSTEISPCM